MTELIVVSVVCLAFTTGLVCGGVLGYNKALSSINKKLRDTFPDILKNGDERR